MLRAAIFLFLLGVLAAAPAAARPSRATAWPFWLSKPERHGSRKLAGDFTHINTTYRYHSRERRGVLGFLHLRGQQPVAHHKATGKPHAGKASRKHTSGMF